MKLLLHTLDRITSRANLRPWPSHTRSETAARGCRTGLTPCHPSHPLLSKQEHARQACRRGCLRRSRVSRKTGQWSPAASLKSRICIAHRRHLPSGCLRDQASAGRATPGWQPRPLLEAIVASDAARTSTSLLRSPGDRFDRTPSPARRLQATSPGFLLGPPQTLAQGAAAPASANGVRIRTCFAPSRGLSFSTANPCQ